MSDEDMLRRGDVIEVCTRIIKDYDVMKPDGVTYEPARVQSAAKGMVSLVRQDIRALPAVTVQAQIDAAREAALQEVEAKLNSIDMRSCQFEWHPYTAGYIRSEFEKAIALIRKGDQP